MEHLGDLRPQTIQRGSGREVSQTLELNCAPRKDNGGKAWCETLKKMKLGYIKEMTGNDIMSGLE